MGSPILDYGLAHSGTVEFDINATKQQVRDAVNRAIDERGAEVIKIGEQRENMTNFKPDATIMTLDQLATIADQAQKRGLKSTIHHTSVESFNRALKAGVSSLAHVPGGALITEDDINMFVRQNYFIEPTMSVSYDSSYEIKDHPTFNGAECMGIEDDFGSIEVGKTADLAVFDGNPFQDPSVIGGRVAALFKDGKLVINNCMLPTVPE